MTANFLPINSAAVIPAQVIVEETWDRPIDWLTLPTLSPTDKKLVGLVAVFLHGSNFLAVSCAGAYTVDWGDGSASENIATGVQANHLYDYSTISASTTSTLGYRQAIVTITPQTSAWTTINIGVKHAQSGLSIVESNWLDVAAAGSTITNLTVCSSVTPRFMRQFTWVGTNAITSMSSLFSNCVTLQSATLDCSATTTAANMFSTCRSLKYITLSNTSTVTKMNGMFANCSSLGNIPLLNTINVNDMSSMFSSCTSLETIPLLNTAKVTNMSSMFSSCVMLPIIPLFDTSIVTNMSTMFIAAGVLTIPLLNTGAVLNMSNMFSQCQRLLNIPLLNTASVTDMTSMFYGNFVLQVLPPLNTTSVTNAASIFTSCLSLSAANLNGTSVTISYSGCSLSALNLVDIFNGLSDRTGYSTQTITISGNWGATLLTAGQRTLATAKNWTIVG